MRYGSTYYNRFNTTSKAGIRDLELKWFDSAHDKTAAELNPATADPNFKPIGQLNLIKAGSGPNQRLGRKINIKEIQATVICTMNAHQSDVIRIGIVQDRQCNGAEAKIDDVFAGKTVTQFPKIENNRRFNILMCKMKSLNFTALGEGPANGETRAVITFKMACNIEINFGPSDADAQITDVRSNNLFMFAHTYEGKTKIASHFRVRYSDV